MNIDAFNGDPVGLLVFFKHSSLISFGTVSLRSTSCHQVPPNALRAFLSAPDYAKKNGLAYANPFFNGDPGAIRTPDPQLRRLLLYPAELQDHGLVLYKKLF